MKRIITAICIALLAISVNAQIKRPYDEKTDAMTQLDQAIATAKAEGKNVIAQVGGNWCKWCLLFADFIEKDNEIAQTIADNYVYIHTNFPGEKNVEALTSRLGNPKRFGFPCLVFFNSEGERIHIQDSSLLEEGKGYNREKVLRVLQQWMPEK